MANYAKLDGFVPKKFIQSMQVSMGRIAHKYYTMLNIRRHDAQHVVYCYAECHLCSMSRMLSVTNKPIMLSVIKLNDVMPSVVAPNLIVRDKHSS